MFHRYPRFRCLKFKKLILIIQIATGSFLYLNNPGKPVDKEFNPISEEMESRVSHLKDVCHQLKLDQVGNDSLHKPDPWEYLINKEHHLVWCNVFKSGSSSWMSIFLQLAGKNSSKTPSDVAAVRRFYARPTVEQLLEEMKNKNSTSFIIARNPIERLGYRDKIEDKKSQYKKLKKEILSRFGKALNRSEPTFKRSEPTFNRSEPTFSEFVQFVLDENAKGRTLDEHWVPVYKFCNPCQVNLTDISKMETFDRDQEYLLEKSGIKGKVETFKKHVKQSPRSSEQFLQKYIDELSPGLFENIVNLYLIDFKMFDYTIPTQSMSHLN